MIQRGEKGRKLVLGGLHYLMQVVRSFSSRRFEGAGRGFVL